MQWIGTRALRATVGFKPTYPFDKRGRLHIPSSFCLPPDFVVEGESWTATAYGPLDAVWWILLVLCPLGDSVHVTP